MKQHFIKKTLEQSVRESLGMSLKFEPLPVMIDMSGSSKFAQNILKSLGKIGGFAAIFTRSSSHNIKALALIMHTDKK